MYKRQPPLSEAELLTNAGLLSGKSLQQIAGETGYPVPAGQKHAKGWIGELMEIILGATAASRSEPDFQLLGIELKTIPVGKNNRPKESTYVCTVSLKNDARIKWEHSSVKRKLTRVLWVPVEADSSIPLGQRRVGNAFLWSPDEKQETILRKDWEEIMDMICMGELEKISSRLGRYLQIRPKAANARALTRAITGSGASGVTLPRGFYLRTAFTGMILNAATGD